VDGPSVQAPGSLTGSRRPGLAR